MLKSVVLLGKTFFFLAACRNKPSAHQLHPLPTKPTHSDLVTSVKRSLWVEEEQRESEREREVLMDSPGAPLEMF